MRRRSMHGMCSTDNCRASRCRAGALLLAPGKFRTAAASAGVAWSSRDARRLPTSPPCRPLLWPWRWLRAAWSQRPTCLLLGWPSSPLLVRSVHLSSSEALPPQPGADAAGRAGAHALLSGGAPAVLTADSALADRLGTGLTGSASRSRRQRSPASLPVCPAELQLSCRPAALRGAAKAAAAARGPTTSVKLSKA